MSRLDREGQRWVWRLACVFCRTTARAVRGHIRRVRRRDARGGVRRHHGQPRCRTHGPELAHPLWAPPCTSSCGPSAPPGVDTAHRPADQPSNGWHRECTSTCSGGAPLTWGHSAVQSACNMPSSGSTHRRPPNRARATFSQIRATSEPAQPPPAPLTLRKGPQVQSCQPDRKYEPL